MATQRPVAAPLLPDAPSHGHDVHTLAACDRGCGSGQDPGAKRQNLAETALDERRRRRKGRRFKLSEDKRNQAVQAFWAMLVETLNWSGMTVRQYAATAKLSKHSLRRWRDLIDSGEVRSTGAPGFIPAPARK
jgi:hypothetical protein